MAQTKSGSARRLRSGAACGTAAPDAFTVNIPHLPRGVARKITFVGIYNESWNLTQ
uniref:Uncharacterized protein n=1 Tax=Myoviridae sp. ctuIn11 TaxID=2827715 RepID=A0A8S5SII1_9CAUD|nr:MAG TPA: hypothetical protein [Myoviridae sp. ctuIn11]DAH95028.1 MAG TPA: hypothetical protein [Caudoviricetes sp.]